ncbi:hypothetical protein AMJ49_03170 [Parcubacteria bacterium DG_74_2]|nr:MAG: hypothetical protein AMJ49_03170 [Parcubacteria bacterium DG_74_2]
MRQEIIKRLKKIGVSIHKGGYGYNPISGVFGRRPVCAMWHESEEPTKEEMTILERIVKKILSGFDPSEVKGFAAKAANTVTLKKEQGKWAFRRLTWKGGLWSSNVSSYQSDGSLITIENLL